MQVSDDPRVGTELAGYRIEALLGRGGMSVVYLAEDVRLRRKVALKLLAVRPGRGRDRSATGSCASRSWRPRSTTRTSSRSTRPARSASCSSSPCATSRGATSRSGCGAARSSRAEAIGILAQVASALDAAHARGLVHRDVKPSNVLLDTGAGPDGSDHAYLADFGLTKRLTDETGTGDDGHLMGTIDYVAPEQIAGEEVDGRADVYSLGCVLYECLVGQPPFRRDSRCRGGVRPPRGGAAGAERRAAGAAGRRSTR